MIRLDNISKSYGSDELFKNLDWQFSPGQKIGLVGPNGAGKTTLFRVIVGQEETDRGQVIQPRGVRVGYLPQELAVEEQGSVIDLVLGGRRDLLEMEAELERAEAALAAGESSEQASAAYADLQERFRLHGGYEFRSRAREIASGMGFSNDEMDAPIQTFSGGWQMRALLSRLLLFRPEVLLLDEPTNHLDLESIEWLEKFLSAYEGTIVVISHDRFFLNRLVDTIAELHAGQVHLYAGNYDYYLRERRERRERLVAQAAEQARQIAHIEDFIERFRYKASKARQVQSRVKQLEKIERIQVPPDYQSSIGFEFPAPPRIGKIALEARGVSKRFDDNVIYQAVDFALERGDHVALVGPNGAGKTTLLKMLAGRLVPDEGEVVPGHKVELRYFAQHSVDQLDLKRTVLQEMEASATMESVTRVRSILGAFLFSGDDVHKPISVLSGGEKGRLALAKMLLEPAGVLLLDEPTNHLDISSRQVLEHALRSFEGAFCVISHDRYFLNEVVNKVVLVDDGQLKVYPGSYEEFRWRRERELAQEAGEVDAEMPGLPSTEQPIVSKRDQRRVLAAIRKRRDAETRSLRATLKKLEEKIEVLEEEHGQLQARLADPATYDGGDQVAELNQRFHQLEDELTEVLMAWEEQGAQVEAIEERYAEEEAQVREA
ncbi:hypothetical protein DL240_05680 [Lujinxingia litoralis]|uniref:ABC transporter domain-containing protein n=1 Tax=Lujinxingia litoralis TaxID=2211119 RepID=A0A328CB05_9DELT|nr:ABC-F family ATP-binding cassette domain-containing protein [Lujinxingia litoralis]RAL23649.1 hypothetical protein DL240_05680 [Lujinxingia litoralis]